MTADRSRGNESYNLTYLPKFLEFEIAVGIAL